MDATSIKVPPELFATAESSSYEGEQAFSELQAGPDTYRFDGPLVWNVTITNTGEALLVAGSIRGRGTTQCGRCLEDVTVDVDGEVEGYFLLNEPEEGDEGADADDDYQVLPEDNVIDLEPLLVGAVVVDLPLVPLCRPDCAGICPDCGVNLNEQECDCAVARAHEQEAFEAEKNPFAKLRELNLDELGE